MQTKTKLDGRSERMLLVIMFQGSAIVKIVTQRRFEIESKQTRDLILSTYRGIDRQLPRALVKVATRHFGTDALLNHRSA